MSVNFFPRNKNFWIYHGSILLVLALIQTVIILLWREERLFNFLCGLLWLPLFTLAVVFYRYLYKTRQWNQFNTGKNILVVIGYSLVSGLIVASLMLGLVTPFFWSDVEAIVVKHNISMTTIMTQLVITNWFQTQLFVGSWIFIYISITTRQLIKETEVTNLRLQNSLKEAQLANLSNQLNPHFLFNTLNNIKFTVRKDPLKSEKMITDLSDILRYSLESNKHEKVQISDELEIVRRYIDIIKVQMENRLNFEISVPESLYSSLIPPMILQLLIENAIKHGVDNIRHGGKVQLTAEASSKQIHFKIINDIPNTDTANTRSTGIGLVNIEQRLKLLYGNNATLDTNNHEQQFTVMLTLPQEIS
jgi:LytS/YehU family sensor histidine kinase